MLVFNLAGATRAAVRQVDFGRAIPIPVALMPFSGISRCAQH